VPLPNPAVRYSHPGNAVITELAAPITAASTSFTVRNSAGWSDGSGGPFFVVLSQGKVNVEKVLVSSRTGDTCTVSGGVAGRGQDGTSPTNHDADVPLSVYPCITAFEIDLLNAHAAAASQVHGVAGNVVGHNDAQTISNKTLDSSNAYAGGALSGTFTGSPTLSGNPTLSGTPVFSGAPSFTGAALFTGDPIFQDAAAGGIALLARVAADGTPRFAVLGDGKIEWGPGSAARDTNLYRDAAGNRLKTDDALDIQNGGTIAGTWTGAPVFSGQPEFTADPIFRRASATDEALLVRLNGDANARLRVQADGKLVWSDGAGALDTNLFRDAANVLRTNDSLIVDADLTAGTNTVKLNKRPRAKIYKTGNQSLTNNTYEAIVFAAEDFDSHNMHDNSTNNTRITPNKAGLYWLKGQVNFDPNSTGHRDAKLTKNGTTTIALQHLASISGVETIVQVAGLIAFNGSTDYVELFGRQNSGAGLNANGGAAGDSHLEAIWMADDATSS